MKNRCQLWTGIISSLGLLTMIVDSKTALSGAREGIELCLYTVIPSLFPFFILSTLINRSFTGKTIRFMQPICKACGMPAGSESIFLLGLLGGYPVGAQAINEAYANKALDKQDAQRMLGFCSNAGPAFIFGMVGSLFTQQLIPWVIWMIQIVSAMIVGMILPGKHQHTCRLSQSSQCTLQSAVEHSVNTMVRVCSWVIVFRVLNAFIMRWFLWIFPKEVQVSITGILELSNGCYALNTLDHMGTRFVLSTGILALGGICVAMQTVSITKDVGTGMYFPGKVLQTCISLLLAGIAQPFLFSVSNTQHLSAVGYILIFIIAVMTLSIIHRKKKVVEIMC